MLLRRLARPLFASWFVTEGLDVVRHPAAHAAEARASLTTLRSRLPEPARQGPAGQALGRELTERQLTSIVQAHGAALAGAGVLLAVGKAPRTAALALAALTVPLILTNLPTKRLRTEDPAVRKARRDRFVRALAFTGGALIAGVDLEGRPGISWRLQKARSEHAAAKVASD
ncbi:DoxX family membrane protein [Cellulomonas fengjieae]|uniref:DoxX family membrane protein n=1 Tax=Cellulomonas fengjieae TaxID=2819978 RepID=UPI001AAFE703|nr:DoxX family membrane protein [Cellulomonas fengjieae]MBO3103761.1 DoxX family membrane protein [Cellulomonas fengjieae]